MTVAISNMYSTFANSSIRYDAIGMNVNASAYADNSTIIALRVSDEDKFSVYVDGNTAVFGNLIVSGQITSNGSSIGGGGGSVSIVANNTSTEVHYLLTSTNTSGVVANTIVSNTKVYFVPTSGTLSATVFNSLSDLNRKDNIEIIEYPLEKIDSLNGVTFTWKESKLPSAGLIAQDVEKILPCLVDDHKSLNYNGVVGLLVECIKDLKKEIVALKEILDRNNIK